MTKTIFVLCTLLLTTITYAQKLNTVKNNSPISIYTFEIAEKNKQSTSAISKRLQLKDFKFRTLNVFDDALLNTALNFKTLEGKEVLYVYDKLDTYNNNNNAFLVDFLIKNDPTRWNLQCLENRVPPNLRTK